MPAVKQRGTILAVTVDGKNYEVGMRTSNNPLHHRIHHIVERMDPNGTICWAVYVELYSNEKASGYVGLWKDVRGTNVVVEYKFDSDQEV